MEVRSSARTPSFPLCSVDRGRELEGGIARSRAERDEHAPRISTSDRQRPTERHGRPQAHAKELARIALAATTSVRSDLPLVVSLLERNPASKADAKSFGLRLIWQGTDADGPAAGLRRLLFANRDLSKEEIAALPAH